MRTKKKNGIGVGPRDWKQIRLKKVLVLEWSV